MLAKILPIPVSFLLVSSQLPVCEIPQLGLVQTLVRGALWVGAARCSWRTGERVDLDPEQWRHSAGKSTAEARNCAARRARPALQFHVGRRELVDIGTNAPEFPRLNTPQGAYCAPRSGWRVGRHDRPASVRRFRMIFARREQNNP